ncbi:uncharacterized protein BBA_05399 [Beauveria bassiana ARSEF 2860]|uniref:Uncharacterized protein n=1 Tax=Beauveria bassiana (strain ARSEF 2860) TaxID=655819 RepID=J4W579_BEAB2|nr:uncharacterized protein BBA_05399 [Beauveria bassiana ARSEF 2860]EJP65530.1 hypothetical protein BBA_05399 [Beauveria bassiana ARSEF 2860]
MATHTKWLNGPEDVMFAWTKLQTYVDRTGQLRLLLKESADELDSNNYSIFVVASELERRLLITRVNKDEGDMLRSCTRVAVHSYQSLLECLRSTDCLEFTQVTIPQFDMMADKLQLVSIASSDFVDYVVEKATEVIKRRKMVIIFCTRRTEYQILRRMARELLQENCLWNEIARADFIAKKCLPEPNTEEGVILFMTESCQVPLYFDHVCHIFIEGLKDKPTWNRSRIVYERQVLMRDEAECMISY